MKRVINIVKETKEKIQLFRFTSSTRLNVLAY